MSEEMLSAEPGDAVREAVRRMASAGVAATVVRSDRGSPGIITARDVLDLVGAGCDLDAERVGDHSTPEARTVSPDAALGEAAEIMSAGGFRHLIVTEAVRTVGMVSMRDIVRSWVDERATPDVVIPIREGMSTNFLAVSPDRTVRDTARSMSERELAAAVVTAEDRPYPSVFTERELLDAVASGEDLESALVGEHTSSRMTFSAPNWSLKQAAEAMSKGGFQHVLVVDLHEIRGVLAMRDIVRTWTSRA